MASSGPGIGRVRWPVGLIPPGRLGRGLPRHQRLAPARDGLPFDRGIDHRIARLRRRMEHPAPILSVRLRRHGHRPAAMSGSRPRWP